jgi:hypothetical protein
MESPGVCQYTKDTRFYAELVGSVSAGKNNAVMIDLINAENVFKIANFPSKTLELLYPSKTDTGSKADGKCHFYPQYNMFTVQYGKKVVNTNEVLGVKIKQADLLDNPITNKDYHYKVRYTDSGYWKYEATSKKGKLDTISITGTDSNSKIKGTAAAPALTRVDNNNAGTAYVGNDNARSWATYKVTFTAGKYKQVATGEVHITLKVSTDLKASDSYLPEFSKTCKLLTGWQESGAPHGDVSCELDTTNHRYIIRGFKEVPANTKCEMQFMIKNPQVNQKRDFEIKIEFYGTKGDINTRLFNW